MQNNARRTACKIYNFGEKLPYYNAEKETIDIILITMHSHGTGWICQNNSENQQNGPIKVMANTLQHTIKPEHIIHELRKCGWVQAYRSHFQTKT